MSDKAKPKAGTQPVEIVVAEGTIKGLVALKARPVLDALARPGQPVQVRFGFRFDETSKDKERYLFTLNSRVVHARGEVPPVSVKPATATFNDRWGLPDSGEGALIQQYRIAKDGQYMIEFEVIAEYQRVRWGGLKVDQLDMKSLKGSIPLNVLVPDEILLPDHA